MHAFAFLPLSILRPANERAAVLTSDTMKENLKKENKTFPNLKKKKKRHGIWSDGSALKSTCCSAEDQVWFPSPTRCLILSIKLRSRDDVPMLPGTGQTHSAYTYVQTTKHAYT